MLRPGGDLVLGLIDGRLKGGDDIFRVLRAEDGRSGHDDIAPLGKINGRVRVLSPGIFLSINQRTGVSACIDRLGSNTAVDLDIFLWEPRAQLRHLCHASV